MWLYPHKTHILSVKQHALNMVNYWCLMETIVSGCLVHCESSDWSCYCLVWSALYLLLKKKPMLFHAAYGWKNYACNHLLVYTKYTHILWLNFLRLTILRQFREGNLRGLQTQQSTCAHSVEFWNSWVSSLLESVLHIMQVLII